MQETHVDPGGHSTAYRYDDFKRRTMSIQTVGTEQLTTKYDYDLQDGLIKVTDPRGIETNYVNGDLGWRLKTVSADTGTTEYKYDPSGNLIETTNFHGTAERRYDALNRLTRITYPNDPVVVEYSYDSEDVDFGIGRRTGMLDASGESTFSYDRRGLLIGEQKTIDGTTYVTGYRYDPSGNLTEIQYPESPDTARRGFVNFGYDDAERVSLVSVDLRGEAATIADSFEYKPFGPRTRMRLASDLVDARRYDTRYQPVSWAVGSYSTDLLDYDQVFDLDGNLTQRIDNRHHANDRVFGYDEIHRLTTASGPWGLGAGGSLTTYTYDNNGNRLSNAETQPSTTYAYYAGTNRLLSATQGSTVTNYLYNANGSTTDDGAHTYVYSDADRLVTVDDGMSTSYNYTYDGDNRRVKKTGANATTYYFYDPAGHLLTEMHRGNGAVKGTDYLYLEGSPFGRVGWYVTEVRHDGLDLVEGIGGAEQPVQYVADKAVLYYHADHLGTPIAMTDMNGELIWSAEHRPFGEAEIATASTTGNDLRFPGQYFDQETGLHQNWFRDYDPKTGRYREADPIGLAGGLNPYSYVENQPSNLTDSPGLSPFFDWLNKKLDQLLGRSYPEPPSDVAKAQDTAGLESETGQTTILGIGGPVLRRGGKGALTGVGAACGEQLALQYVAPAAIGLFGRGIGRFDNLLRPGGVLIGKAGTRGGIREVRGGAREAEGMFLRLAEGGVDVTPRGHPGMLVELPGGGKIGYRPVSGSGPPAIDINIPGYPIDKIHYVP